MAGEARDVRRAVEVLGQILSVVVPEEVWDEIDLNIASVTVHRELMERLGLGVGRRSSSSRTST